MSVSLINFNSKLINAEGPILSVNNRAFKYGDALFETIRAINGKPVLLNGHLNRLKEGMKMLKMIIPQNFDEIFFQSEIVKLLEVNKINSGARLRISVFRDSDGFYTPNNNDISYIIECFPLSENEYVLNEKGWQIDIFEDHRKTLNKLSSLKSTNSLPYILAGIYKKEKKLDECIILNELGNISEAITSNIFIVYNGVFYTPSLNQGCIGGIMRKVIIDMVKEGGREVQECPLNPNALLRADEVFLTNSINGIRWVNAYRMKRYFNKASKLLVEQLNDRITAQVMLGVSVSS